jgi:hypothetical protein
LRVVMGSASCIEWPMVLACVKISKSLPPTKVLSPKKWISSKSDSGRYWRQNVLSHPCGGVAQGDCHRAGRVQRERGRHITLNLLQSTRYRSPKEKGNSSWQRQRPHRNDGRIQRKGQCFMAAAMRDATATQHANV